jgi:hypothetical protein
MAQYFQQRSVKDVPDVIEALDYEVVAEEQPLLKVLFRIGRNPENFNNMDAEPAYAEAEAEFKEAMHRWGVDIDAIGANPTAEDLKNISRASSAELAEIVVDDQRLDAMVENIKASYESDPERFTQVRIAYPSPIIEDASDNSVPIAYAVKVQEALPEKLKEAGIDIDVVIDIETRDPNESILNASKNKRGGANHAMERLARQPVYVGEVHNDAIYAGVEDFVVMQGTSRNFVDYIVSNGGELGFHSPVYKNSAGVEQMTVRDETVDLLKEGLRTLSESQVGVNGDVEQQMAKNQLLVNSLLRQVGYEVDFNEPSNSTATDQEVMYLACHFCDLDLPEHMNTYSAALEARGGSVENAQGTSMHEIAASPAADIETLHGHFKDAMQGRELLEMPKSYSGFAEMIEQGKITRTEGITL